MPRLHTLISRIRVRPTLFSTRVRLLDPVNGTAAARDTKRGLAGVAYVDSYLQSLGGEICLILPPSERTCRRLSQVVTSRETLRTRKVINTKSDDNQNRKPHKNRQQRP